MYIGSLGTFSNRETWSGSIGLIDNDTGQPVQTNDQTVVMSVGDANCGYPIVTISTETGDIVFPDTATFQWTIPVTTSRSFYPGTYSAGITITSDTGVVQLFSGSLIVTDGVVP